MSRTPHVLLCISTLPLHFFVADQSVPPMPVPFTRPAYLRLPAVNVIVLAVELAVVIAVEPRVPETSWYCCVSVNVC